MADYQLSIDGTDVADISNKVSQEEVGGAEFQDSSVAIYDGKVTNLMTFQELVGKRPKMIHFVVAGGPAPANSTKIKNVVLYVGGDIRPSVVYREK